MPKKSIQLQIINTRGLHARAAAKLVKCIENFDAEVMVAKDNTEVIGTSIMGLLMLGASKGCMITVSAKGTEADNALACIEELVLSKFEEDH